MGLHSKSIQLVLLFSSVVILLDQLVFYHYPINFDDNNNIVINTNTDSINNLLCAIGVPPWVNNNFTKQIIEFNKTWQNSPDKINRYGGGFFHYFALWNMIHSLKPTHIIESGAFNGIGTWFIRQAAGDSTKLVIVSPQTPSIYYDTNAIYYSGDKFKDFNTINWQDIVDVQNTLVFIDDHQAAIRRMKEAQDNGFQHIVFDDNYFPGYGDNLSAKKLCTPYLYDFMNKTPKFQDNFGQIVKNITKKEYEFYVNEFKQAAEIYAEFPPVWPGPIRFDIDAKTLNLTTQPALFSRNEIENMGINVGLDVESKRYTHIEYIKLKSYLLSLGNETTNTFWTVNSKCLQYKKKKKHQRIIIYGVGAGEDISWDIQMIEIFNVESYIFDPTVKSIRTITPIINRFNAENKQFKNITFTHEGLSTKEGTLVFKLPENKDWVSMREIPEINNYNEMNDIDDDKIIAKVNSLKNWMKEFNHDYLDVLKIDIEGSEYSVLEQFINEDYFPFTQLLVEYHDRFFDVYKEKHEFVTRELINHGFQLFYRSKSGNEMSYIKTKDLKECKMKEW